MKKEEFEKSVENVMNDLNGCDYITFISGNVDKESVAATIFAKGDPEKLCNELVYVIMNSQNQELADTVLSIITNAVAVMASFDKDYGKRVLKSLKEIIGEDKAQLIGINDGK